MNHASTPTAATVRPTTRKNTRQWPSWVSPSRPPKTTSIATRASIAITPSTRPRSAGRVTSVTQAWYAASFAPAPRKDITQSRTTTATTATATAWPAGAQVATASALTSPNPAVVSPQATYPRAMNGRRLPTRSDAAPTSSVASVAVTALAATSTAITVGSSVMVSWTNTLRYMFSTVQASWPARPSTTTRVQRRPVTSGP